MDYKIKFCFLLVLGVLLNSCSNSENKKATPLDEVKEKEVIPKKETIEEPPLVFKVQIAALKQPNKNFDSIENVAISEEGGFTKYRLGAFKTYKEAKKQRIHLLRSYKGAFVQAIKNEVPVSISKALQD